MHSCFETAGAADTQYLVDAMTEFYSSVLQAENNTFRILK
jgi:aspartyl aminopeptidase